MTSHGKRSVDNAGAAVYEREKGVVLFASVERGSASETFMKARPHIERGAAKGHVAAVANSSEVCHLEPERMLTVNNRSYGLELPEIPPGHTRAQALGVRLD